MPRPDPLLLEPARYPFSCTLETRFGDMDVNAHLNNVSICALLEEGRVRFHYHIKLPEALARSKLTTMLVSLGVEYMAQTFYPAPVTLHAGVVSIGKSSYALAQLLTQNDRPAAFAHAVFVCTDKEQAKPIPEDFRLFLQSSMIAP